MRRECLGGQIIYRDFFQFTTPGTESVYFLLFRLLGVHAWIPNVTVAALGLGLVSLAIFLSKRIVAGASVFLAAVLFLVLSFHPSDGRLSSLVQHAGGDGGDCADYQDQVLNGWPEQECFAPWLRFSRRRGRWSCICDRHFSLLWERRNRAEANGPIWEITGGIVGKLCLRHRCSESTLHDSSRVEAVFMEHTRVSVEVLFG